MDKIVFRSYPRLFILVTTFFGSILMGLLARLSWQGIQNNTWLYIFPVLFGAISLYSLFLFINIRVVRFSASSIQISYLIVPIRRTFPLHEVKNISQQSKMIDVGNSWSKIVQIPYFITVVTFTDNKIIKLNSIGALEYEELMRCFNKLNRGNGEIILPKKKFLRYILDSWDGLGIVTLLIILTIGLGIALVKK